MHATYLPNLILLRLIILTRGPLCEEICSLNVCLYIYICIGICGFSKVSIYFGGFFVKKSAGTAVV